MLSNRVVRSIALAALLLAGTYPLDAWGASKRIVKEPAENGAEENGEEQGWKLKAKLNRAFLYWNDRDSSGFRHVDNDQDSTGMELEGKFKTGPSVTTTIKFGLDAKYIESGTVSQFDKDGNGFVAEIGDALIEFEHERFGKLIVGHGDSASDGTGNVKVGGVDVLADAEVNNWNDSFFLRVAGMGATMLRWGDYFAGPNVGETGRFVRYVTPNIMGFEASAAVGRPQEIFLHGPPELFVERNHGLFTDFALRFDHLWNNEYRIRAELGVFRDTTEEKGATEPTRDTGVSGGIAIMHVPTGLNLSVNHGVVKHARACEEPGAVSGKCRGPDKFVYVKGGVVRNIFEHGPTAWYGEFYRGWRTLNESSEDALRAFERVALAAEELKKSTQTMWGVGIVQTIKASPKRRYVTDLYLGYRHYELDVVLLGAGGGKVPARDIKSIDLVMGGVRFRWGEEGETGEE